MRPLKERVIFMDGLVEVLKPLATGLGLTLGGGAALVYSLRYLKDYSCQFISAVFLLAGLVFLAIGIGTAYLEAELGGWSGQISRGDFKPGTAFDFRFEQHVRRKMNFKSVGVFLVRRDTLHIDSKVKKVDRLVTSHSHDGRVYQSNKMLVEECRLLIPAHSFGPWQGVAEDRITPPVETTWLIKVRLTPKYTKPHIFWDQNFWREFEIEVEDATVPDSGTQPDNVAPSFNLFLAEHGYWTDLKRAMAVSKVAPHLSHVQLLDLCSNPKKSLIRERMSRTEAEEAKAFLESEGVDSIIVPLKKWETPAA